LQGCSFWSKPEIYLQPAINQTSEIKWAVLIILLID
jgi:hypothetical protein